MTDYKASELYMLRTPIFPFNLYEQVFPDFSENFNQNDAILKLITNNIFLEALSIASPDLFFSIQKFNEGEISEKKVNKLITSIMKYIIRSSTRTTPFGLFAGIDIGTFKKETSIKIKEANSHKKRARVDMGWLYGFINTLESDKSFMENVKVKFNDICYIKGDRIVNPVIGYNNPYSKSSNVSTSIRFTNQVKAVKNLSHDFILFENLSKVIKENNQHIENKVIDKFLYNLLKNQYLLSELRPPLSITEPIEYLIDKINENDKAKNTVEILNKLNYSIHYYNNLKIGEGLKELKEIWKIMSEIYKYKNYLQVDLKLETNNNYLGENVKHEMEQFANLISELSKKMGPTNHINEYTDEFIQKYGFCMEVPILELLDPDIGLGAPSSYQYNQSNKENNVFRETALIKEIKNIIYNKIIECVLNNNKEIVLSEKDFGKILDDKSDDKSSDRYYNDITSFDMNFLIFGKNEEEINKGNFRLAIGPNIGSSSAGNMFGRFSYILPENEKQKVSKLLYSKEVLENDNDIVLVHTYETTLNGKMANICINNSNIKYKMFLGQHDNSKNRIEIKDIYVGCDQFTKKLYLKSKSLNKEIKINSFHMLNPNVNSNVYRFLKEISDRCSYNIIELIFSLYIQEFNYIPRIYYNKVVIIPANWKLSLEIIKSKNSLSDFILKFKSWRSKYNVPKYVYSKNYDNRLLFNLDNMRHIEEIFNLIKNSNINITLYELEDNISKTFVKDNIGNSYFCEIIVPFLLNENKKVSNKKTIPKILITKSDVNINSTKIELRSSERILFPNEEGWWYYNLYCNANMMDDLICNDIFEICEKLVDENLISMYFFIRYSDPDTHIRLRFKINSVNNINNIISKMQCKLFELKEMNLIKKINIGTYEREIERYGGLDLIRIAEEFFYYDSMYVANIIKSIKYNKLNLTEEEISLVSLASMLKCFKLEIAEQSILLSSSFSQKYYRKEFNKKREQFINLLEKVDNDQLITIINDEEIYNSLNLRNKKLEFYYDNIIKFDNAKKLTNTKSEILFTLLHMFCNRYKGDTLWESKIMMLLRHGIYSLNEKKMNFKNEEI